MGMLRTVVAEGRLSDLGPPGASHTLAALRLFSLSTQLKPRVRSEFALRLPRTYVARDLVVVVVVVVKREAVKRVVKRVVVKRVVG
jgi:hypothetical protein